MEAKGALSYKDMRVSVEDRRQTRVVTLDLSRLILSFRHHYNLLLSLEQVIPFDGPPSLVDPLGESAVYSASNPVESLETAAREGIKPGYHLPDNLSSLGTIDLVNNALPFPGAADHYPLVPSLGDGLVPEHSLSQLYPVPSTGITPKNMEYPEFSFQETQHITDNSQDPWVSYPFYADTSPDIVPSGICSPPSSQNEENQDYMSLLQASIDFSGSQVRNELSSFAQTNRPMQMAAHSSLSLPLCTPSTSTILDPVLYGRHKGRVERSIVDIETLSRAFTDQSPHPDPQRRSLLDAILRSFFYLRHQHEPRLGTSDGNLILEMAGLSSWVSYAETKESIFSLMINWLSAVSASILAIVLLFVKDRKFDAEDALTYGEFHFPDRDVMDSPARFFTRNLLHDHITKQNNRDPCPYPNCNASIRPGGMRRHYKTKHPLEPFPNMKAERKRANKTTNYSSV
ncbi:hypothetical protein FRC17_003328 [Serendipita sp. 399]|nr:hypothetical protein FRC17_003328 [Serendipita sp. 399]